MFEEPLEEIWTRRYGAPPPAGVPEAARPFLAHRSVRRYTDEPMSEGVVAALVAAAHSAATSSNLQTYSMVRVQAPERRSRLAELAGNRPQIEGAPLVLCFLADLYRLARAAEAAGHAPEAVGHQEFFTMACVDAALAAERLVGLAENLGYGVCYIGGLRNDPEGVREFLRLPRLTFGLFALTVGRPAPDHRADVKPRLAPESVFFDETYPVGVDVSEYDARMAAFYAEQGMKGPGTWSDRSGARVAREELGKRADQRAFLAGQELAVE